MNLLLLYILSFECTNWNEKPIYSWMFSFTLTLYQPSCNRIYILCGNRRIPGNFTLNRLCFSRKHSIIIILGFSKKQLKLILHTYVIIIGLIYKIQPTKISLQNFINLLFMSEIHYSKKKHK